MHLKSMRILEVFFFLTPHGFQFIILGYVEFSVNAAGKSLEVKYKVGCGSDKCEVLTTVLMKIQVAWDVMPYQMVKFFAPIFSVSTQLGFEEGRLLGLTETSVTSYQSTQLNIPQDLNFDFIAVFRLMFATTGFDQF